MKKTILTLSLICLGFAQTLPLDDYIVLSLTKHPLIGKTQADYMSQLRSLETINGINDWNLFLNTSYTNGYAVQGTTIYSSDAEIYQFNVGATSLMLDSGTRVKIASDTMLMRKIPSFLGGASNVYATNINFSISQPILKNAFGKLDKYPLTMAKYNKALVELKYAEDLEDFYKALVDDYLAWQLAYTTVKISEEQLEKAKEQVDLITQQYNKGASEKLDLVQAKQNLKAKSVQSIAAKQDLKNKYIKVASRIGDSVVTDFSSIIPQKSLVLNLNNTRKESIEFIKTNSSMSKALKIQEKIQKETMDYKKDLTQPSAELFLSKTFGTATNKIGDIVPNLGNQAPLTIGLKMETSLENTISKKESEAAEFALEKIKKQNEETFKMSIDGITTLFENIKDIDLMINENKDLISLAIEHTDLEEKRFKQGRSSLYFVIAAQDQLLNIKLQLETLKTTKAMLLNQLSSQLDQYQKMPLLKSIINANKGEK